MVYNHRVMKKNGKKYWDGNKTFKTIDDHTKRNFVH